MNYFVKGDVYFDSDDDGDYSDESSFNYVYLTTLTYIDEKIDSCFSLEDSYQGGTPAYYDYALSMGPFQHGYYVKLYPRAPEFSIDWDQYGGGSMSDHFDIYRKPYDVVHNIYLKSTADEDADLYVYGSVRDLYNGFHFVPYALIFLVVNDEDPVYVTSADDIGYFAFDNLSTYAQPQDTFYLIAKYYVGSNLWQKESTEILVSTVYPLINNNSYIPVPIGYSLPSLQ